MNTVETIKELQKLNFDIAIRLGRLITEVCPHDEIVEDAAQDDEGNVEAYRYCKTCLLDMPVVHAD